MKFLLKRAAIALNPSHSFGAGKHLRHSNAMKNFHTEKANHLKGILRKSGAAESEISAVDSALADTHDYWDGIFQQKTDELVGGTLNTPSVSGGGAPVVPTPKQEKSWVGRHPILATGAGVGAAAVAYNALKDDGSVPPGDVTYNQGAAAAEQDIAMAMQQAAPMMDASTANYQGQGVASQYAQAAVGQSV